MIILELKSLSGVLKRVKKTYILGVVFAMETDSTKVRSTFSKKFADRILYRKKILDPTSYQELGTKKIRFPNQNSTAF